MYTLFRPHSFAYRITYYSSQSSTEPTGYYDGWGQWRAADGSGRLALDNGIETVEHGGNKYIVHPKRYCGTSINSRKWEQLGRSCELFLTYLIVTNDDVIRYSDKIPQCKNVRLKELEGENEKLKELIQQLNQLL